MRFIYRSLQTTALAVALAAVPELVAQTVNDQTPGSTSNNPSLNTPGSNNPNSNNPRSNNPTGNNGATVNPPGVNTNPNAGSDAKSSSDTYNGYYGDRSQHRHDFGWIGLLGLAGLIGLTRRDRGQVRTTERDDIRPGPRV